MREISDIEAAQDQLKFWEAETAIQALPPGYRSGVGLKITNSSLYVTTGVANVSGVQVEFTSDFLVEGDSWEAEKYASQTFYVYLVSDGNVKITMLAPAFSNRFVAYYHPNNDWRYLGRLVTDSSNELAHAISEDSDLEEDFAIDVDTFFVDISEDRVGINTATPRVPLDVGGGGILVEGTAGTNYAHIGLEHATGNTFYLDLGSTGNFQIREDTGSIPFIIRTGVSTNVVDITSEGLEVHDALWVDLPTGDHVKIGEFAGTDIEILTATPKIRLYDTVGSTGGWIFYESSSLTLSSDGRITLNDDVYAWGNLVVNTDDLFVNASTGNVGIGTSSPNAALQVGGTTGSNNIILSGGATGQDYWVNWTFNNPTTNVYNQIGIDYDLRASRGFQINSVYDISFNDIDNTGSYVATMMFIDNATYNVGIGTSSPTEELHLKGASGATAMLIEDTGVNGNSRTLYKIASHQWNVGTAGSQADRFFIYDNDAAAYRFVIDTSGNVGIGTSSPGASIEVNGATNGFAGIFNRNNGFVNTEVVLESPGTGSDWSITAGQGNGGFGIVERGVATQFTILDGGNVGIGTSSPGAELHVNDTSSSSANAVIMVTAGSTGSTGLAQINMGDADDNDIGRVRYNNSSNELSLWTNNLERLTVDSSGNVGIGTSSPSALLQIGEDVRPGIDTPEALLRIETFSDSWKGALEVSHIYDAATVDSYLLMGMRMTGGTYLAPTFDTHSTRSGFGFQLDRDTTTEKLHIITSAVGSAQARVQLLTVTQPGNVGIGTSSPGVELHVKDTTADVAIKAETDKVNGAALLQLENDAQIWSLTTNTDDKFSVTDTTNSKAPFIMEVNAPTNSFYIDSTGNVGIGTTIPNYKLHVNGGGSGVVYAPTNSVTSALTVDYDPVYTTTGNHYSKGIDVAIRSTGTSGDNTGYLVGYYGSVFKTGNHGITNLWGVYTQYGNYTSAASTTDNAMGLYIHPYATAGTITNMYDIFMNTTQTGGTVTNHWGIYQAEANDNYFAGNVGINDSTPSYALDVNGHMRSVKGRIVSKTYHTSSTLTEDQVFDRFSAGIDDGASVICSGTVTVSGVTYVVSSIDRVSSDLYFNVINLSTGNIATLNATNGDTSTTFSEEISICI